MDEPHRDLLFVADGDRHVRRLVRQFVGDAYTVEFFDDGYTLLDRARRTPPGLIVTEILIPELDGLALCRLLKGDTATADVPVIVLSMLAAAERATASGARAFLAKPLERGLFVATLRGLTDHNDRGGARSPHHQGSP